jgi:ATPase subunit of ABC transporter with duplicated ATPase domains
MRVLLAQALFGHPQALLLDEPTNHLDLDSIHWLKNFLNQYEGVLIVISHDRHFLNGICTHIADIDYETIITYTGTYDDMVVAKTQIRSQIESQNAQREKKIDQLNEFIARFAAGTRSSQVQSRRKEVERLQVTELAKSNIQRPFLKFEQKRPSGKHILEIEGISQVVRRRQSNFRLHGERASRRKDRAHGPQRLRQNDASERAARELAHGFRVGTAQDQRLRRTFCRRRKSYLGSRSFAVGYFAQDHKALIEPGIKVLEWLHQWDPSASTEEIRGLLGRCCFPAMTPTSAPTFFPAEKRRACSSAS